MPIDPKKQMEQLASENKDIRVDKDDLIHLIASTALLNDDRKFGFQINKAMFGRNVDEYKTNPEGMNEDRESIAKVDSTGQISLKQKGEHKSGLFGIKNIAREAIDESASDMIGDKQTLSLEEAYTKLIKEAKDEGVYRTPTQDDLNNFKEWIAQRRAELEKEQSKTSPETPKQGSDNRLGSVLNKEDKNTLETIKTETTRTLDTLAQAVDEPKEPAPEKPSKSQGR